MPVSVENLKRKVVEAPPDLHLRVLGPPGSGKTSLLIERYRALVSELGSGHVFILTYSNASLARINEQLFPGDSAHVGFPPVLTHFRLAREVIAAAGRRPPQIAQEIDEALLIERVVRDRLGQLESDYRSVAASSGFRRELLRLFRLLLQNGIDAPSKRQALVNATRGERLRDVLLLFDGYVESLGDRDLTTFYNIAHMAAGHAASAVALPLQEARVLLIDDFQDIDAGQYALLERLAPPEAPLKLNVFGDPMGALFSFRGTDDRFLRHDFPERYGGETVHLPCQTFDPALAPVIETLLGATIDGGHARQVVPSARRTVGASAASGQLSLFDAPPSRVTIEIADDEVEEAYRVAARVHDLIAHRKVSPADVAVITNDKTRYEPLVRLAFTQRGIALDTGRRIPGNFTSFARALLAMLVGEVDDAHRQAVLTSPLYPYLQTACLKTVTDAATDPTRADRELRTFASALAKSLWYKPPTSWMQELAEGCFTPVCTAYRQDAGDDSVFAELSRLAQAWESYAAASTGAGTDAGIDAFLRLSGTWGEAGAQPNPGADEVGFYSCREAKGMFWPVVVVIGCAELLFPSVRGHEGVMPAAELQDSLGRAFPKTPAHVYAARSPEAHLREQLHLMHVALTRATDELHITAPSQFGGEKRPAPAAVLESLQIECSAPELDPTPAALRFARGWVRGPHATHIADGLADVNRLGVLWNLPAPVRTPVEIAPFPLSKSSLESYLQCPRLFFYRKVLRLKEDETVNLQLGSLFHKVLAMFGERYRRKSAWHAAATEEAMVDGIDLAMRDDGRFERGTFMTEALRHYLLRMVDGLVRLDASETGDYAVDGTEVPINFDYDAWLFTGRIDRVDKTSQVDFSLADYKTGEFTKKGETLRKRVMGAADTVQGADWQVPMYVWGFHKTRGVLPSEFRYYIVRPGEDPFAVTLHIRQTEEELPPEARSRKQVDWPHSYVLEHEVEVAMDAAAQLAARIFAGHAIFDKTENTNHCRNCAYKRVCERAS